MPWRGPAYSGELPTLGYQVLGWITDMLAAPDRGEYEPLILTREQAQFVLNFYALDPATGRRAYRRALLSRPKGWGKSPLLAALAAAEALGDVVPAGWDAAGEPVGRPWSTVRTPLVQLAAISEDQTRNAWDPLLEMLRDGPVIDAYPGLEPLETFVNLPRGRIEPVTSSWSSREGNPPVFAVLDQTEAWVSSNGGVRLAKVLRRNLGKTGGSSIESPNAYEPGAGSVAEASAEYAKQIDERRTRDDGLLWDHREAPSDTDMTDHGSLLAGLTHVYGEAADVAGGWVDLERLVREIWDPATDPEDARRFYLNQITHAADAYLSQPEWAGCTDLDKVIADRDVVVLGFDGSRSRVKGMADATALIGCRVSDGHFFEVGVWEPPAGPGRQDWEAPQTEIDAAVHHAFDRWSVVGLFADPTLWDGTISGWEARYGSRLVVKASATHPMFFIRKGFGEKAKALSKVLESFHAAVVDRQLTHDGSYALTRHALNARRRPSAAGMKIAKEHDYSIRKIDAIVAAVYAWAARLDALAKGLGEPPRTYRARGF